MKRIFTLFVVIFITQFTNAQLALKNDTFIVRDTAMNYTFVVTANDVLPKQYQIVSIEQASGDALTMTIVDSNRIQVLDTGIVVSTAIFKYRIKDNMTNNIDSAFVTILKQNLQKEYYLGDCNNDGTVNNFDILYVGLKYGSFGSPRHFLDINSPFKSCYAGNWKTATRNLNDKYIDVDGNGRIDTSDSKMLPTYANQSWKTPVPFLSAPSVLTSLTSKLDSNSVGDTLLYISGPISIPVKLISSSKIKASYGLAYSFELKYFDNTTQQELPYPVTYPVKMKNFNLWSQTPLMYFQRNGNRYEVGAVKTNQVDDSTDGYPGVVEIVVDIILIGIKDSGNVGRFTIDYKDALWMKSDATSIDVTPKPYTFFIKNIANRSSISSIQKNLVNIFPNPAQSQIFLVRSLAKKERYQILNIQGQRVIEGEILGRNSTITVQDLPKGMYYLRLDSESESFKIQKD
jgi:hypothetical protein